MSRPADLPVPLTLELAEVEWLEQSARFGAAESVFASNQLDTLAKKLAKAAHDATASSASTNPEATDAR